MILSREGDEAACAHGILNASSRSINNTWLHTFASFHDAESQAMRVRTGH